MSSPAKPTTGEQGPRLRRALTLWDLVFYGIILIQPTAPMPLFGIVAKEANGHVALTLLIAMCGMLFTAISYGRMARAYPAAGSAYTYVGREIHPSLGYVTGWSMAMDYMLNPLICTIWCSKAAGNIIPEIPYSFWAVFFAVTFTLLNLRGIKASARINEFLAAGMGIVIVIFFAAAIRYLLVGGLSTPQLVKPFYDSSTFSWPHVLTGTSIAVLTYIGFDGISTLSEEVENPRRNILWATVLTCLITGVLATLEVYVAQLVWPDYTKFCDPLVAGAAKGCVDIDTAYSFVAGRAGGPILFQIVNFTLLIATVGSGMGAQLAAARLLYGMGRDSAIPKKFFGAIQPTRRIPQNNVIFVGAIALIGAFTLTYQLGAELLNFGAFIAFMGVNAAAMLHYYWREAEKKLTYLIPPMLGFIICFYIWLNLRTPAKIAGGTWCVIGILYGAYKTKGFKQNLVHFETSLDD